MHVGRSGDRILHQVVDEFLADTLGLLAAQLLDLLLELHPLSESLELLVRERVRPRLLELLLMLGRPERIGGSGMLRATRGLDLVLAGCRLHRSRLDGRRNTTSRGSFLETPTNPPVHPLDPVVLEELGTKFRQRGVLGRRFDIFEIHDQTFLVANRPKDQIRRSRMLDLLHKNPPGLVSRLEVELQLA
jgi:hypothetical protein